MAFKRKLFKRKAGKRRRYGRQRMRKRHRRGMTTVFKLHRGPVIVPDHTLTKLKYTTTYGKIINPGTYTHLVFRGNSIWDPDYTLGGRTVTGFTEWSVFYDKYIVFGSKIRVSILNKTTNAGMHLAIVPTEGQPWVEQGNSRDAVGLPYSRWKIVGSTTGMDRNSVKNYMNTAKIFGLTSKAIRAERDYQGTMGSGENPLVQWFWNILVSPLDDNATHNYIVFVQITYYVDLYRRHQVATTVASNDIYDNYDPDADQIIPIDGDIAN